MEKAEKIARVQELVKGGKAVSAACKEAGLPIWAWYQRAGKSKGRVAPTKAKRAPVKRQKSEPEHVVMTIAQQVDRELVQSAIRILQAALGRMEQ